MKKQKLTNNKTNLLKLTPILLLISCATNCPKDKLIIRSLNKQNILIQKITNNQKGGQEEPNKQNKKVLLLALEKIQESNQVVIKALNQHSTNGEQKHERRIRPTRYFR